MTLSIYLRDLYRICLLDKKAIDEVSKKREYTFLTLIFFSLGIFLSSLQNMLLEWHGFVVFLYDFVVFGILINAIGFSIIHYSAKVFGSTTEFVKFFRPNGIWFLFAILFWLSLLPVLGGILFFVVLIWFLVAYYHILKIVYKLTSLKSILVLIVSFILIIVVFGILIVLSINIGINPYPGFDLSTL